MPTQKIIPLESALMRKPVLRLVGGASAAGFIGLCGQALQIVMDGWFLGNGIGAEGLSTMAIVVPLLSFAMAMGCMLGVGSTSLSVIALGEGDREGARAVYGASVWLALFAGLAIAVAGYAFSADLARALGSPEGLLAPCTAYIRRFFVFFPFIMLGCVWYHYARLEGHHLMATLVFVVPAFYAIAIEYMLIYWAGAGMESSSTAFGITVGSWSICGIYFLTSRKTLFKVRLADIRGICPALVKDIAVAGLASCSSQVAVALVAVNANFFLARFGTAADLAAFGVLNGYIIYIFSLVVTLAFAPSAQTIVTLGMSAGAFGRVRKTLLLTCFVSVATMAALTLAVLAFDEPIALFFCNGDAALAKAVVDRLPFYVGLFSLGSMSFVVSAYFQAIEHDKPAVFLSLLLNCLSLVPIMLLMTHVFGGDGVWYAVPVSDMVTFAVTVWFLLREERRLRKLSQRERMHVQKGGIVTRE